MEFRLLNENDEKLLNSLSVNFRNTEVTEKRAERLLTNENVKIWAAIDNDNVCGYVLAYLLPRFDSDNDMMTIYHCFVLKEYRRRHIAETLMNLAIEYGKQHNVHYITLFTQSTNTAARALYEKLGGELNTQTDTAYFWYINAHPLID